MISFDEAYRIALGSARVLGEETIALGEAVGRVLAQDVVADAPMPPYDKAMVDGYACRRADLSGPLCVLETIAAGHAPKSAIGPGECAKIMTGAKVPEGADCVFLVEQSQTASDGAVRFAGSATDANIAPSGRDYKTGELLVARGSRVHPPEIAVMASVGCVRPRVYRRPSVAVLATGDELVEPGDAPDAWHIRNSNASQLVTQVARLGIAAEYLGIARDNAASVEECLGRAAQAEVLLISGGVSMGDFDLVPAGLRQRRFEILFDRVAIQPGKPTTFAAAEGRWCFGLPGNPVSSFVVFEILVKPFLYALMNHAHRPTSVRMPASERFTRKSGSRKSWVPVTLGDCGVRRMGYFGSSHINALCGADGMIAFEEGVTEIPAGTLLDVRLIKE